MTETIARSKAQIISKFLYGIGVFVLIRIKGVIYIPALTYFLSKEQIGEIGFLNNLASLAVPLLLLNLPDSCNRLVLKFLDEGRTAQPVYNVISAVSLIASILMIVVFLSSFFWASKETILLYAYLLLVALARTIQKLSMYKLQILQHSRELVKYNFIVEYLPLPIIFLFLWWSYEDPLWPIGAAIFGVIVLFSRVEIRSWLRVNLSGFDFALFKQLLKISIFLMPALYAQLFMQSSDLIFVKWLLGDAAAGDFVVANSLAALLMVVSSGIGFFWYSSVKYIGAEVIRKLVIGMAFATPILSGVTYYAMQWFVQLVQQFVWQEYALLELTPMLAMFYIQLASVQILAGILYSHGRDGVILRGALITLSVNLICGYLLITQYGLIGAGASSFIATSVLICYYLIKILAVKEAA